MQENVCEIVREMEQDYVNGNTTISKYVDFDMYETLNKVDAYLNSKHTSGSQDSLGRDKPFYNIVTAARNIWYRATDIDRKNIRIRVPKTGSVVQAFAANMLLKQWMKRVNFGAFLNEWGRTLATYGSAVSKFVEKDGELFCSVIPWNRIICDPIDFEGNVRIEVLEYTPAQLRKQKGYDKEMVKSLLDTLTAREDLNKQKKDNKSNYIKVYEVHGEMPLSCLTGDEKDEDIYVQQMHVVSYVAKNNRRNTDYQDFTLYKGKEKKDPYMISHLIKEDGRTLGIGAVEHLFEAQWMVNHTAKQIKDTLDFASLLILQTSDGTLTGQNVLQNLITGDILIHAQGEALTQLNNQHDITQIQNFSSQWQSLAKEITSTPDAIRGNTQPSGTAYRLQQLITNESHSLFEIMTENKGLDIARMCNEFVIPHVATKMDNTEEISEILDSAGVTQFDSIYVPQEANKRRNAQIKDQVLAGQIADDMDVQEIEGQIRQENTVYGNQRFMKPSDVPSKTWKESLKDFVMEAEVDPTQESEDIIEALTTLDSTFKTIVSLGGRPMSPDEKLVFGKIMEKAGSLSPIELNQSPAQPQLQTQQPQSGGRPSVEQLTPIGVTK